MNHIDHAVKVAGIDHVGIGTDFDGGGGFPGFNDHSEAANVTEELVRRGYSEQDVAKIWGGNLMRVWRDVQKVAEREKTGRPVARRAGDLEGQEWTIDCSGGPGYGFRRSASAR